MSRRLVESLNSWIFDDNEENEELYAPTLVFIAHLATEIYEMDHFLPWYPCVLVTVRGGKSSVKAHGPCLWIGFRNELSEQQYVIFPRTNIIAKY